MCDSDVVLHPMRLIQCCEEYDKICHIKYVQIQMERFNYETQVMPDIVARQLYRTVLLFITT